MGNERNDGSAGRHIMLNDDIVTIDYFDLDACKTAFNTGVKRTDPDYKKVGWFWTCYIGASAEYPCAAARWHGPFSASSAALRDAKARYALVASVGTLA